MRFDYTRADGQSAGRRVEPHAVVAAERAFYLVAWDRDRDDWRTFRLDRMAGVSGTGARDQPREPPSGDLVGWASSRRPAADVPELSVVVDLPVARLRDLLGRWASGARAEGPDRCRWPMSDSSPSAVLTACAWLPVDVDFRLEGPAELVESVAAAAARLAAATTSHATAVPSSSTSWPGIASRVTPSMVVGGATSAAPSRDASTP